eukprot:365755_1
MSLLESWRWFGPPDPVKLNDIAQTGVRAIVSALHEKAVGEVWTYNEIKERKDLMKSTNNLLEWKVVECVPVHESIKLGLKDRDKYISNYIETLKNLSLNNINCVTYIFSPLLDWTRTDLNYKYYDGSYALAFNYINFAIFELFLLKNDNEKINNNALKRYNKEIQNIALKKYKSMTGTEINQLKTTLIRGLPGRVNQVFSFDDFKKLVKLYQNLTKTQLRNNFKYFLDRVIPKCVEYNINLALHPDDPPISDLLGIPRAVCTYDDIKYVLNIQNVTNNGIELCVGTMASRANVSDECNEVYRITNDFKDRIHSVHLRNIVKIADINDDKLGLYYNSGYSFIESNHLDGNINMYKVLNIILNQVHNKNNKTNPIVYWRPDHGHFMLGDITSKLKVNPGYPMYGRMKGLCELRGIIFAIQHSHGYQNKITIPSKL